MKLSALAVRRPVTTGMFFLAIVVLGLVSLSRLAVDQLPDVTLPSIPVSTIYEGAAPEIVERLITEPLGKTLATINNIKAIRSFSGEGSSRVSLDFNWGANLDLAALEVHEKVSNLVRWLPDEAEPPRVSKYDPVVGGLSVSTAFTLFFVPALYSLIEERRTRYCRGMVTTSRATDAEPIAAD